MRLELLSEYIVWFLKMFAKYLKWLNGDGTEKKTDFAFTLLPKIIGQ